MTYKSTNLRQTAVCAVFAVLLSAVFVTGAVTSAFAGTYPLSAQLV